MTSQIVQNEESKLGDKVYCSNEFGAVTAAHWINGYSDLYEFDLIRLGTNKENDFEDWRGMFGSFA